TQVSFATEPDTLEEIRRPRVLGIDEREEPMRVERLEREANERAHRLGADAIVPPPGLEAVADLPLALVSRAQQAAAADEPVRRAPHDAELERGTRPLRRVTDRSGDVRARLVLRARSPA